LSLNWSKIASHSRSRRSQFSFLQSLLLQSDVTTVTIYGKDFANPGNDFEFSRVRENRRCSRFHSRLTLYGCISISVMAKSI